jgi:hypothetical protein
MPVWSNNPSSIIPMLTPGVPGYSAGSKNQNLPDARLKVSTSQVTSNVVTLGVKVVEGYIPAVGSTAYVSGTSRDSGNLNKPNGVALTAVTIDSVTGIGTISYAATAADLVTGADFGDAVVTIPEVAETLVPNQAYQAFAIQKPVPRLAPEASITLNVKFPSAPASASWQVQGAINNVDAEYVDIFAGTAAGTFSDSGAPAGLSSTVQFWPGTFRFIRFKDTGSSGGTSPTVIAKFSI